MQFGMTERQKGQGIVRMTGGGATHIPHRGGALVFRRADHQPLVEQQKIVGRARHGADRDLRRVE